VKYSFTRSATKWKATSMSVREDSYL
jgi:hypothetical protein